MYILKQRRNENFLAIAYHLSASFKSKCPSFIFLSLNEFAILKMNPRFAHFVHAKKANLSLARQKRNLPPAVGKASWIPPQRELLYNKRWLIESQKLYMFLNPIGIPKLICISSKVHLLINDHKCYFLTDFSNNCLFVMSNVWQK